MFSGDLKRPRELNFVPENKIKFTFHNLQELVSLRQMIKKQKISRDLEGLMMNDIEKLDLRCLLKKYFLVAFSRKPIHHHIQYDYLISPISGCSCLSRNYLKNMPM